MGSNHGNQLGSHLMRNGQQAWWLMAATIQVSSPSSGRFVDWLTLAALAGLGVKPPSLKTTACLANRSYSTIHLPIEVATYANAWEAHSITSIFEPNMLISQIWRYHYLPRGLLKQKMWDHQCIHKHWVGSLWNYEYFLSLINPDLFRLLH